MRKRANQRLARLAKMTDDKGHVFLMYQIEPFEPKLCLPPDSDPDFCSLWTRSIASLTYWHWVVVYEQEALRLWLTDNGLLSMNKRHCVSDLQTVGCCLWTRSIASLTYWQWLVVYEQEALCHWLTDNGLSSPAPPQSPMQNNCLHSDNLVLLSRWMCMVFYEFEMLRCLKRVPQWWGVV